MQNCKRLYTAYLTDKPGWPPMPSKCFWCCPYHSCTSLWCGRYSQTMLTHFVGWAPSQNPGMTGDSFSLWLFKVQELSDLPAEMVSLGINEHAEPGKVLPREFNCCSVFPP